MLFYSLDSRIRILESGILRSIRLHFAPSTSRNADNCRATKCFGLRACVFTVEERSWGHGCGAMTTLKCTNLIISVRLEHAIALTIRAAYAIVRLPEDPPTTDMYEYTYTIHSCFCIGWLNAHRPFQWEGSAFILNANGSALLRRTWLNV